MHLRIDTQRTNCRDKKKNILSWLSFLSTILDERAGFKNVKNTHKL